MALVVQVDGKNNGESKVGKHEGWIDVDSLSRGSSNPVALKGGGFAADLANMSEFMVTSVVGKHSPLFEVNHLSGQHFNKVIIEDLIVTGGKDPEQSKRFTLEEVFVTSYNESTHSGSNSRGIESYSLSFGKLEIEYFAQDEKGKMKSVGSVKFDNKAKKVLKGK